MPNQDETEAVEGQSIARAILAEEPGAWDRFYARYVRAADVSSGGYVPKVLTLWALKRIQGDSLLRSQYSAEDLVQGFVTLKVMQRRQVMLTPCADGRQPLHPRLIESFENYCHDRYRKVKRAQDAESRARKPAADECPPEAEGDLTNANEEIIARINDQLHAIREAALSAPKASHPRREFLLLSERLILAERIVESFSEPGGAGPSIERGLPPQPSDAAQMAASLGPWTEDEKTRPLPNAGRPLEEVWRQLAELLRRAPHRIDGAAVAAALFAKRNTWEKWVQRARLMVVKQLGIDRARKLFPCWPKRLFTARGLDGRAEGDR
jgi:hypothetical protein